MDSREEEKKKPLSFEEIAERNRQLKEKLKKEREQANKSLVRRLNLNKKEK